MSLELSPNPREFVGANGGPALDAREFEPASFELQLLEHCAKVIALMLDAEDRNPERIIKTKQGQKRLLIRKILFFCLQEERPFGDSAGEVRYGHIAQVDIQNALGIYRKTISLDVQDIQRWCERSVEFEAFVDTIRDAIDAHVANFGYHARILELATHQKALDRIRGAVDLLERK